MLRSRTWSLAACFLLACGKVTSGTGGNQAPVAMAAELSTYRSTPVEGQLEAEDADGDELAFAVAEDPGGGALELDPDGSFRYTPARGTSGADSFSFVVEDGAGGSDQATVDIAIADLTDGTPDATFGAGGTVISDLGDIDAYSGVAVTDDGRIAAAGNSASDWAVVAGYSARGGLLSPWGEGGSGTTMVNPGGYDGFGDVVQQPGGRLVSVGQTQSGDRDFMLLGLDEGGYLDTSFGAGGMTITDVAVDQADVANAVAVLADGRLLVAGYASNGADDDFAVARYSADGILDESFGSGGFRVIDLGGTDRVNAVAIDGDGNLLLTGESAGDMAVARLSPEGEPDAGFGEGGVVHLDRGEQEEAIGVAAGPDGAIYVGGSTQEGGVWRMAVARLTPDGELDAAFGEGGWVLAAPADTYANDMLVLPNRSLLLVGGWQSGAVSEAAAVRVFMSGEVDAQFGTDGMYHQAIGSGGDDTLFAAALQDDGKVVAAGWSRNADLDALLVRLGW